jgi:predicted CXXCH cytochrome family protein
VGRPGLGLVAALLTAGCAHPREADRATPPTVAEAPRVTSNLLRGDYAGSEACADCHGEIHEAWAHSPMRRMTREAGTAAVRAPFDGSTFRLGGDLARMEERDGVRLMRIVSSHQGNRLYRITRVIGGRYREDFAGVDVTRAADPRTDPGQGPERILPVSYVFEPASWRYKGYSVLVRERPGLRVKVQWSRQCIGCHNTLPYLSYLLDELHGPGAPSYQGAISDRFLPPARTWRVVADDPAGLERALAEEIAHLGGAAAPAGSLQDQLAHAMRVSRQRLGPEHLVEIGIGCESCHGGAAQHVEDPEVLPSFAPTSPLVRFVPPSGARATRAHWINRACARCHTVLFSQYPWTWEGGRRSDPVPGGSSINSGEARDLLLGGCAEELACTACHDPHAADRPEALAALAGPAGNALCTQCHPALASPEGLRAHTHHPPGEGSACVACHMAKKNMGLGYQLTRYHRIGSPTDEARVLGDRPLECALCHVDRGVEELVEAMERWWGKRYDRAALRGLYGDDLGVGVLAATLARGKPHEQGAAIGALGERGDPSAIPALAPHLAHPYPLVRYYARHALERLTGAPVPVDVDRPAAEVAAAVTRWLAGREP